MVAVLMGVLGFHFVGDYSWIDAIWMVVITVSTVGYGEVSQSPVGVQIITMLLIFVGLSAAVYTSTGLIQLLLEGQLEQTLGIKRMTREIELLKNHTVICGIGRSGSSLAVDLQRRGRKLVIIDNDKEQLVLAAELGCLVVEGDATQEDSLQMAGIDRASSLVVALPSDADNVFITLTARELNPHLLIVARAARERTAKILRQAGAQKVVMPAAVSAKMMSRMVLDPSAADWLELIAENSHDTLDIEELKLADHPKLIGSAIQSTGALRTHQLLVVAIRDGTGEIIVNPGGQYVFEKDDVAVLTGNPRDIQAFRDLF